MMEKIEYYNSETGEINYDFNKLFVEEGDEIFVYRNGKYFYGFVAEKNNENIFRKN